MLKEWKETYFDISGTLIMGIIKIGDFVEADDESTIMGYLVKVENGNPNQYKIFDVEDEGIYVCNGVKHVRKQRLLEKKMLNAAGIDFKI